MPGQQSEIISEGNDLQAVNIHKSEYPRISTAYLLEGKKWFMKEND